jgi:hypothetical protein
LLHFADAALPAALEPLMTKIIPLDAVPAPPVEADTGAHRDPLSGEVGAHPVGVGIGAAAGGMAFGAAVGTVAGPLGMAVGALVGAVAGGLAGKGVAEAIDPTAEDAYWRANYASRAYATARAPGGVRRVGACADAGKRASLSAPAAGAGHASLTPCAAASTRRRRSPSSRESGMRLVRIQGARSNTRDQARSLHQAWAGARAGRRGLAGRRREGKQDGRRVLVDAGHHRFVQIVPLPAAGLVSAEAFGDELVAAARPSGSKILRLSTRERSARSDSLLGG